MPTKDQQRRLVRELVDAAGRTHSERAGIRLADRPAPLYQLLVLSLLLSTRISADIAVDAARELFAAGYRTPAKMSASTWQQRVDALGRAHYRRYDESTATRLQQLTETLAERYRGDLRRLAQEADRDPQVVAERLQEFPGIGPVGADIFLREAQAAWAWLRPHAGRRVQRIAAKYDLPGNADDLAELAGTTDLSTLSSALIEVDRKRDLRKQLKLS